MPLCHDWWHSPILWWPFMLSQIYLSLPPTTSLLIDCINESMWPASNVAAFWRLTNETNGQTVPRKPNTWAWATTETVNMSVCCCFFRYFFKRAIKKYRLCSPELTFKRSYFVWKQDFFSSRCAVDETVAFIPSGNEHLQRFSIEAFTFLGDHEFVYLHCRVKICNATDPNSRCAQGCIPQRGRRSALIRGQSKDDEANLAEGPFMRQQDEENSQLQETERELKDVDKTDTGKELIILRFFGIVLHIGVPFISPT